jgi:phage terminase large subunit
MHVLPSAVVQYIESQRELDPNWWNVYGLGLVGNIEGLVHPHFTQVEHLTNRGTQVFGLDWGYSNDPTALVECRFHGQNLYSRQLIYQTGLNYRDTAKAMLAAGVRRGKDIIFADDEDPQGIDELHKFGFLIRPAKKGKVLPGIMHVNKFRQYWTKDSLDGIKEQRNYMYLRDKNDKLTNELAKGIRDHLMDARRYAVAGYLRMAKGSPALKGVLGS